MPYLLLLAHGGTLLLVFGVLVLWEYLTERHLVTVEVVLEALYEWNQLPGDKSLYRLAWLHTPLSFIAISLTMIPILSCAVVAFFRLCLSS